MREVSSGRGNRQKATGGNKFLRINEQAETVEVKRPEKRSREKLGKF